MANLTEYDVEMITEEIFNEGLNLYNNPEKWEGGAPTNLFNATVKYIMDCLWNCDIYTDPYSIERELNALIIKK